MFIGDGVVHINIQLILDRIHEWLEFLIAVNADHTVASRVIMTEHFVQRIIQLISSAVVKWHQAMKFDRSVNASQHRHTIDIHDVHTKDQLLVLRNELRWNLNVVLLDSLGCTARRFSFQRSNVGTKNPFSNFNVFDSDGTILNNILPENVLKILDGWASNNVVESMRTLGIFELPFGISLLVLAHC